MKLTKETCRRFGGRILAAIVLIAIGGSAQRLDAQNSSVDGQDACSLACRDNYRSCKANCDPGDSSCADACASALQQCLSNCN